MRRTAWIVAGALMALVAGCSSQGSDSATQQQASTSPHQSTRTQRTPPPAAPIVGRWEQVHTCTELMTALHKAGLAPLAPAMVGDYFPGSSPQQLAKKNDVCQGATPQRHSHFFTQSGQFGSLDQDGNQVDDGTYNVVNGHTIDIGSAAFHYRVIDGKTLVLHAVIHASAKHQALSSPLEFTTAGWQVAVTYEGHPWTRVPCAGWC
jgi:hypothetical protein